MGITASLFGYKCEECGKNRTKRKLEDRYVCAECELKIKAKKEKKINCPKCDAEMQKEIVEDMIIDRCPKCRGVFLDKEELDYFKKLAEDDSSSSMINGMVIGMACGSTMR